MEPTSVFEGLIKFRAALKHPKKDGKNPAFKSQYVTLDALIEAVDAACITAGLGWLQQVVQEERGISVKTTIFSTGGHLEIPGPVVPVSKADAQGLGSAVTYARRYALAVAFGVASDEDDDGNAAAKAAPEPRRQPEAPSAEAKKAAWVAAFTKRYTAAGLAWSDVLMLLQANGLPESLEALTGEQAVRLDKLLGDLIAFQAQTSAEPTPI